MERICGDCRFFKVRDERDDGGIGACRLGKVMGVFRASMRACPSFSRTGDTAVIAVDDSRRSPAPRRSTPASAPAGPVSVPAHAVQAELAEGDAGATKAMMVEALASALLLEERTLGRTWTEGNLILTPSNADLKSKEIPVDQYLHKLVMIRDQVRVMEQKVNAVNGLHTGERIDLHRRLLLVQAGVLSMATGWLPRSSGSALVQDLRREVEWRRLALAAPALGVRWRGGRAVFVAGDLQVDEPIEQFFHRLVVLRDRLLALEAEIEAHPHIPGDDASTMAGYVRRCYGSLTTFNVLFNDRDAYFSSSR
ncbi:MAG: hypothetical protein H6706_21515 [Myxococcales bacterium]|nr:hypothetical protein [Myxococcales bacterium]